MKGVILMHGLVGFFCTDLHCSFYTYFDGEAQDLDAHSAHVGCCHLAHQLRKFVPVLVDLFNC